MSHGGEPSIAARVAELPFDATRKRMTTLHPATDGEEGCVAYTKGAPESVLPRCARVAPAPILLPGNDGHRVECHLHEPSDA